LPGCDACDTAALEAAHSGKQSAVQGAPLPRARRCCAHRPAHPSEARASTAAQLQQRASGAAERGTALAAAAEQASPQARRRRPRHDAPRMKRPTAEHDRRQARGQRAAWPHSEAKAAAHRPDAHRAAPARHAAALRGSGRRLRRRVQVPAAAAARL
jgi:hypothetical protein